MHILLLSAYDTSSHNSWCQGLIQHLSDIQWTYLALPGRYFSWRIRGNPISWAFGPQRQQLNQSFDLIVATSMVDLATLRGLMPHLAHIPAVVYFHENQFAYPDSPQQHKSLEPQMVNLYSALSAERLIFNSHYNRDSFLQGIERLLKQLPDHTPEQLGDGIKHKSIILPVPLMDTETTASPRTYNTKKTLSVVWNHRWEYDKGPDTLVALCREIDRRKMPVQLSVLGQRFRRQPNSFEQLSAQPAQCIQHFGPLADRNAYLQALAEADVVLSTALHEFQGLAMLEGAQHGCIPLAPDRLAYPEWIAPACLYPSQLVPHKEALSICERLNNWLQNGLPASSDVRHYSWSALSDHYRDAFLMCAKTSAKG